MSAEETTYEDLIERIKEYNRLVKELEEAEKRSEKLLEILQTNYLDLIAKYQWQQISEALEKEEND